MRLIILKQEKKEWSKSWRKFHKNVCDFSMLSDIVLFIFLI